MTSAQAKRLGRLGGIRSAEVRGAYSSSWGYAMQAKRGAKAQNSAYPGLKREWMRNAQRIGRGLEPIPLPSVQSIREGAASSVRVHGGGGKAPGGPRAKKGPPSTDTRK